MKYKNILAFPLSTIPLYFEFLKELHARGYYETVRFIVLDEAKYNEYQSNSSFPEYFQFEYINPNEIKGIAKLDDVPRLEEQYGIPTLNLFSLLGHRVKIKSQKPEDNLFFWENYLQKNKCDMVIMPFAAMIVTLSLVQVAKHRNIQVIYAHSIRAFGRSALTDANGKDAIYDKYQDLYDKFQIYLESGIDKEHLKFQEDRVREANDKKARPVWFADPPRRINKKRLISFVKVMFDPAVLKKKLLSEFNYNYLKFGVSELPNSKFFLFPLHYEPEVTLDLLAPFFRDQLTLVKYIAQSLPANTKLVVKEHPGMKGRRDPKFYEAIEAIENVKLLDLNFDSYEVLDNPNLSGVVVINSTLGFEAILAGKPTIVFGNTFYAVPEIATCLTDLTQLPYLLLDIKKYVPNKENVLKFLQALDDVTFEGFIYPPTEMVTWVLEKKNINAISDEFEKRFPSL